MAEKLYTARDLTDARREGYSAAMLQRPGYNLSDMPGIEEEAALQYPYPTRQEPRIVTDDDGHGYRWTAFGGLETRLRNNPNNEWVPLDGYMLRQPEIVELVRELLWNPHNVVEDI